MDLLRINLYIVYREINRELDPKMSLRKLHKKYLLSLIEEMIRNLQAMKKGLEDNTGTRDIGKKVKPTHAIQTRALQSAKKNTNE